MPIFFSPFFSSSTFPWNDISGALPCVDEPVNFGPFGQTSRSCLAFSETQAAGAAGPDPPDDDFFPPLLHFFPLPVERLPRRFAGRRRAGQLRAVRTDLQVLPCLLGNAGCWRRRPRSTR